MKSLSELLFFKPDSKSYDEFETVLANTVNYLYEHVQFELYKEEEDSDVSSLIGFQISRDSEDKYIREQFNRLFKLAVVDNLDYERMKASFHADVEVGGVIPLGNDIVILQEGTSFSLPTSGQPITVHISFQTKDNYEKYHKDDNEPSE